MGSLVRSLSGAAALALLSPAASALDWRQLSSPSNGLSMQVPAELLANGAGQSRNGIYWLAGGGALDFDARPLDGRSVEQLISQNLPAGSIVTYQRRKDNWLAYSGYFRDDIFYGRTHLSCGGRYAHSFVIRYPRAERALYDRVVTRMSHSFRVSPQFVAMNC